MTEKQIIWRHVLRRWLHWAVAALVLLPVLVVCWPEAVNWVARKNLLGEKWVAEKLLTLLFSEETLAHLDWVEKVKRGGAWVVDTSIKLVPENKRAYVEAALHLRTHWHLLVTQEILAILLFRAVFRWVWRWRVRRKLDSLPPEAPPEPLQLPRAYTLAGLEKLMKK